MEDIKIIEKILKSVGLHFHQSEFVLQQIVTEQTSDVLIKLKNILDFHQKEISEELYKKYSKFLNDLLKAKRLKAENQDFFTDSIEFNEAILPKESSIDLVVQGVSLWALNLCEIRMKSNLPTLASVVKGIIKKRKGFFLSFAFYRIKARGFRKLLRQKVLKRCVMIYFKMGKIQLSSQFEKFKQKIRHKVKMSLIKQKYIEEIRMKNQKQVTKEEKKNGIWLILILLAGLFAIKMLLKLV